MSRHQTQHTRKKQPKAVALDSPLYKMFVYSVKIKNRYIDRLMTSLTEIEDNSQRLMTTHRTKSLY